MASDSNNNAQEVRKDGSFGKGMLSFYDGTSVFITGGTGFVGKALIEKLLRTCENIDTIFILMRPKRGLTVEQRYKDLMKNIIFDPIRNKRPELLDKVKAVHGDVASPRLGLSHEDEQTIVDKVSIVIHSAATVRFVEPMSEALLLNTQGTKNVIELCYLFKKLKSVVHVSTAYSNATRLDVEEKVYKTASDAETLLQCANALPKETIDMIGNSIQEGHPNTYTFTKALGENIVETNYGSLPLTIVRPSIVTAAYNEPYPGWVDNIYGVTGCVMEIYRGTLRSGYVNRNNIIDIVPVDFVVNACIAAAWHHTTLKSKEITVYNCTSGQLNPITWDELMAKVVTVARDHPSKYVMLYPSFKFFHSRLVNLFWETMTHLLPGFVFDMMLKFQGKKPIMLKLSRRMKLALVTGEYFACNEWKFSNVNMNNMMLDLKATGEDVYFPADLKGIDWDKYMYDYVLGVRKYVLKDTMDSMPMARKRIQRLHVFHKFLRVATGYFVFNLIFGRR